MRTQTVTPTALSGLPPVYQAETRTYQADRCGPVVQAIHAGQIRYPVLCHRIPARAGVFAVRTAGT